MDQMGHNPLIFLAKKGSPTELVEILAKQGANFDYQEALWG
mgnify:CR=1 FL=1